MNLGLLLVATTAAIPIAVPQIINCMKAPCLQSIGKEWREVSRMSERVVTRAA